MGCVKSGRQGHRNGPRGGMTQEEIDLRAQIAATLDRHTFPGDREALLATAEEHFADDRVLAWLRRLPEGETFRNVQEAGRAMGLHVEEPR